MKYIILPLLLATVTAFSQSRTTQDFHDDHEDAFVLFFYNNTLKMLNQENNPEFEELIKDIDKMKFLRVSKVQEELDAKDFKELKDGYYNDDFEDLMTLRHEGMDVNVFIKEEDGVTEGIVMLMQDDESIAILDVKGAVPLNKMASLISKVQDFDM